MGTIIDVNIPVQWKNVYLDGILSDYDVSNYGDVRNRNTGHARSVAIAPNGYNFLTLYMHGVGRTFSIHRLVAEYFVPNPDIINNTFVDHKDGVKTHNWAWNLEWVTPKENKQRAIKMGLDNPHHGHQLHGSASGVSVHTEEEAHVACKLLESGAGIKETADILGLDKEFVRSLKRGVWKHVTSQYDIPESKPITLKSQETLAGIRYLGSIGMAYKDIAYALGMPDPEGKGKRSVADYWNKSARGYSQDSGSTTIPWVIYDTYGICNKYDQ